MIRSFYLAVYEMGRALRVPKDELKHCIDSVEGREAYQQARHSGRGAVVVTAHLGCFELGMAALVEHENRVHAVFRRDASPRFDRLRSRLREKLGVVEAPVDEGWSTWSHLRDSLASDEVVLIQGDRVMPGQKGVAVPFLNRRLLIPSGPFKLALVAGAPVIPVFSLRTKVGRLRIVVEEPIMLTREDGLIDARHPAVLRLAAVIEKHVRGNPEQWLMVEPLWFGEKSGDAHTKSLGN
jgi:KDO2-lipid IV(A) lauroyltransferase